MKVPKEIREVPRPHGTVVYAFGHDPVKYNVKKREYKVVDGKRVQIDGETIGSIIDMRFVELEARPGIRYADSDMKFWGASQLIVNSTKDILEDLFSVYSRDDALKTYAIAVLRTIDKGIVDYELQEAYDMDYLSVLYPRVPLSKDTVGRHLFDLGRVCSRITEFMELRCSRVPSNHSVAIDGMLKSYESDADIFSEYSRKALKKGTRDISVVFAYDIDEAEPICSKIYAGNQTDISVFRDFLETNKLQNGFIITDKGFSYNSAREVFLDNPGLHFLIPLKRDAKVIDEYRALKMNHTLSNRFGIESRKVRMHDGRFLYAFRDPEIAKIEEEAWVEEHKDYSPEELERMRTEFGTIVFISDLDAPPEVMFAAYEERWELEVLFRFYKHILGMDETRVESEMSVVGTEFVNFISVIMMCRLRKAFYRVKGLQKRPFKANMKLLRKGVMMRQGSGGEWLPRKITDKEEKIFVELGLLAAPEKAPKKRGRPPGSKNRAK